jgi:hypothetical protein
MRDDHRKQLTARERRALVLHLGIEDGRRRTLAEAGRQAGLTRAEIRRLGAALRAPSRGETSLVNVYVFDRPADFRGFARQLEHWSDEERAP